jgi:DNA-binding PadR family transcriptional regulator
VLAERFKALYRGDVSVRYIAVEGCPIERSLPASGAISPSRSCVSKRSGVLELAVLGLLHESPMHGYELRKQLNVMLGAFRAFSYGSLYPCLKDLLASGFVIADGAPTGSRSRIVYTLTAEGKEHLQDLLAEAGPSSWEDENFGVHFAFFGQTRADVRIRILEGRRRRLEERGEGVRAALARTRERLDDYTLELQRHGLESVEREVRWLTELIETERNNSQSTPPPPESKK